MSESTASRPPRRIGCLAVSGLILLAIVVSAAVTLFVARTWLYPQPFEPVQLSAAEAVTLEHKLDSLTGSDASDPAPDQPGELRPEIYRERAEDRVIHFTQREINALIARNPDLAERLALHLSQDLLSATMLVTLPPDLPVFAGQTVRVAAGLRLRFDGQRPVVIIEGVSIMGVPLPAAWLGGLKGLDLVSLYGPDAGFWRAFGEGVRDLRVEQGRLRVDRAE